ncbi:MAG TPA: GntR family transcriptional regulator [Streptosporangiaceae bacterium]
MAEPMYVQIAEDLRAKIKNGTLPTGAKLTEMGLMANYSERPEYSDNVSRNTIRGAMELLVLDGLVEKRPGQGTFVAVKIEPFDTTLSGDPEGGETAAYQSQVALRGREREESIPRVEIQTSSRAPELELKADEQVISRHQERRIDGKPYSLQTSFYPFSYVMKAPLLAVAGEIDEGAVAYIQNRLGVKQAGWRDVLQVRAANGGETEFFGFPAKGGGQVLEAIRTAFDEKGYPMRLTTTVYAADRNRLAYEAGKVPDTLDDLK